MPRNKVQTPKLWVIQSLENGEWIIYDTPFYNREEAVEWMKEAVSCAREYGYDDTFRVVVYKMVPPGGKK